ncbi:LOW QUALITY PROTEIN: hypothetical protein U9M48_029224 [Paspalum notatum var. saurae]|uniref:Uncharacterized protein n=1 Tax=Paspalum notatum var. saurae TaxID=547442 RepID=A0AAQ3X1A3_PASNO
MLTLVLRRHKFIHAQKEHFIEKRKTTSSPTAASPQLKLARLRIQPRHHPRPPLRHRPLSLDIAADPLIICSSATASVFPLLRLVPSGHARTLRCCNIGHNLEFSISFFGSFEQLIVIMKRNKNFLLASLDSLMKANIALLLQCGLSVPNIAQLYVPLGVPCSPWMFKYVLGTISCHSKEKVAAKHDFFKRTFGCTESEVFIALSKMPSVLGISGDKLPQKIEFLVNEVGME